jgi:CRISPR/Cas system-associated exonuclease Cas4 (RecB family)
MPGLHVSVSQVKQYLRCPRQYRLARVLGVEPAFTPSSLAFGSAIHEGLATYYRGHMAGGVPTLVDVVAAFEAAWQRAAHAAVPIQFGESESWEELRHKGVDMLTAFMALQREPQAVEAVELPFEVELHDPVSGEVLEEKLVGTVDAIVREGERLVLLEHKTSARRYSDDQLRFELQVAAYKMAARKLGMGEVALRYQVITKAARPTVQLADVERDSSDEADFLETVVGVLKGVDSGIAHPIRGWQCATCPYARACPGHR